MATKDLLDSNSVKHHKPAAKMNPDKKTGNTGQKTHAPCKNSLPT